MRGIRESADAEISALDDQAQAALYADARAGSFAQSARALWNTAAAEAGDLSQSRNTFYVFYRAVSDSDLVKRILGDPNLWQLTTDLPTRSVFFVTKDTVLRRLDSEFSRVYLAAATDADRLILIRLGSQALRDASLCALSWLRDLEDFASTDHSSQRFEHRRDALRQRIHRIARQALRLRDEQTLAMLTALTAESPAEHVVERWLQPNDPQLMPLWHALDAEVTELRSFTSALSRGGPGPSSTWRWFPPHGSAVDLAPFIAAEGIPDTVQLLQFAQITAAERTPFQSAFSELSSAQRADIVSDWLALPNDRFASEATTSLISGLRLDP
ncbi:MAG: hypothetical protein ABUL47_07920, partial [Leifsonia sp.]